jgi:deoxyadenosine/deoxycytidine kinase
MEWDLYSQWVNFLFTEKCRPPRGFIYLQCDPDICHARIAQRKREGESLIPLEYLQKIHNKHEQFLLDKRGISSSIINVPVLTLDANIDFIDSPGKMKEHAARVAEFISETSEPLAPGSVKGVTTHVSV